MTGLFVSAFLSIWPLPPDAGATLYADMANFPNEPNFVSRWPLLSFRPPEFVSLAPNETSVGMSVDRAWSFSRGNSNVTIAVIDSAFDFSDESIAHSLVPWPAHPDAGIGFNIVSDAGITSKPDAGIPLGILTAQINDGIAGIGMCPGCRLLPILTNAQLMSKAVDFALTQKAQVIVLPQWATYSDTLAQSLENARNKNVAVVASENVDHALGSLVTFIPGAVGLDTNSTSTARTTRHPLCAANPIFTTHVSSETCAVSPFRLAGAIALLKSYRPELALIQIEGLLTGTPLNLGRAMDTPVATGLPVVPNNFDMLNSFTFIDFEACSLASPLNQPCPLSNGRLDPATVRFPLDTFRSDPTSWQATLELKSGDLSWHRVVNIERTPLQRLQNANAERIFGTPRFVSARTSQPESLSANLGAMGDLDGDGILESVQIDNGILKVFRGEQLILARMVGESTLPPMIVKSARETVMVVCNASGLVSSHTLDGQRWTFQIPNSATAVDMAGGDFDQNGWPDVALTTGKELQVLMADSAGLDRLLSWQKSATAKHVAVANLVGDAKQEIVSDFVYRFDGVELIEIPNRGLSETAFSLGKLNGSNVSLVRVEKQNSSYVVVRDDLQKALRGKNNLVESIELFRTPHRPVAEGSVIVDASGDNLPEVILPTENGLVFVFDATADSIANAPKVLGTPLIHAASVGIENGALQWAVVSANGTPYRFAANGFGSSIQWESARHDAQNTNNYETPLPPRVVEGIGMPIPPGFMPKMCGCQSFNVSWVFLGMFAFYFRRRERSDTSNT
jgi:hypothetical protein